MEKKAPLSATCSYRKPLLVDGGAVELRTKNNVAPDDWEQFEDNIVWGQLATEPTDEVK